MPELSPEQAVAHLHPAVWAAVNRHLVGKAIAELAHELVLEPRQVRNERDWADYTLATDRPEIEYRFRAQRCALDHWRIDRASIRKLDGGADAPLDALRFVVELRARLAIPEHVLPEYLHELSSTLYSAAYKHARGGSAEWLARAPFQEIEAGMTEGHPMFVANNARIGFSARDYPRYAPEAASPVALVWLAAARDRCEVGCVEELTYEELIAEELSDAERARFDGVLREHGLDPAAYLLIPVHPWQWESRVAQLFAPDLASGALVYLGTGDDRYLAQQSIRTLFNTSQPHKHYVKTALSILNMGFTRGMSATLARRAAAVNDWVDRLVREDADLRRSGFSLLREVAFVGFRHRYYEAAIAQRAAPHKEMLAALWRENPVNRLRPGQRLMTMAALLHVDRDGAAVLPALIKASGLGIEEWLRRYLDRYLKPLVHCFYAHHLVFTPHCENTILVLEDDAVVGVMMKDLAEDIGVLNPEVELPESVRHLALRVPEDVMALAIFTDVFDCVFRVLAPLLVEHAGYPEASFWRLVAACIHEYEREHPELAEEIRRYDLFAPELLRNCLNRLQLRNNRMMVDLNAPEPADSLQFAGMLGNPIAPFRAELPRAFDEVSP
jgi:siderophore synthetase component